jgi:transcriptional regulator with XRE-family HTH domain
MNDLHKLAWRAGIPRARLAERLGVTRATLERYLRDDRAPAPVTHLLEILAGTMPWDGFEHMTAHRGAIYYRDQLDGLPACEIPAYHWRLKELEAVRVELSRYQRAPAQYLLNL